MQTHRVGFDELLAALKRRDVIDTNQARDLFEAQDRQLALLVQQRGRQLPQAHRRPEAARRAITPVELFLSFGLRGADGQPFREDLITEIYAAEAGLAYEKLDPLKLDADFTTSVFSKAFARKHTLLALADTGPTVKVATCDPANSMALDSVERVAGKQLELVISSKSDIQRLITEFYGFRDSVKSAARDLRSDTDLGNLEQFVKMKTDREIEATDQHVVAAVEYLLSYAFEQRASDIHVEPKRNESMVRLRIDGTLHQVNTLPKIVHNAVINRLKTLSRLDIGEKRRPQDGRIKTEYKGKAVEIRVSTLPVAFGEKVVMRIFDPELVQSTLGDLGFFERELAIFERLIAQPHGIILVTGPTGSGKTTTLYTALRTLATDKVNISTIEDPIEMVFESINQTAIQPAIGLSFAASLRTLLRQDPDIIMVGEIRDGETAQNAIQAALTGHLVFSTLHTNDAPTAVSRLLDLGVESFLLASTLSGVMAQRLVKKICPECVAQRTLSAAEVASLALPQQEPVITHYGEGCVLCRKSGYHGRSAVYELFEVSEPMEQLIMSRESSVAIKKQAQEDGMPTLREAAIKKMLGGITSFEEVLRVTRPD